MKVTVQFFGAFRNYGPHIELEINESCLVNDVKNSLFEKLKEQEPNHENLSKLLKSSRLSTSKIVLDENDLVGNETSLAILPPVSGGKS